MKLDWRKTFLIGLGFFGISVVWELYNNFVPLFLQAGRPDFETTGTYLASQTGSALAPFLTATVVDLLGGSYRNIFVTAPIFFVVAIVAMSFVTRGEAHRPEAALAATD